jgi:hypothetical protein
MLFQYLFLYLLLVVCSFYLFTPLYAISIVIIIIIVINEYILPDISYSFQEKNIPRYTKEQMLHTIKHGDIITTCPYKKQKNMSRYFNHGFSHMCIVVEEQGQKWVIESYKDDSIDGFFPPHRVIADIIKSKEPFQSEIKNWYKIKTPFIEYLLLDQNTCYCIYRHPTNPPIHVTEDMYYYPQQTINYCTLLVGNILYKNGVIPKSSKYFRYQTNEIIQFLSDAGYESFYLLH